MELLWSKPESGVYNPVHDHYVTLNMQRLDTVAELARRDLKNLHAKILEVNKAKKLVRRPPTLNDVTSWVEQAKNFQEK